MITHKSVTYVLGQCVTYVLGSYPAPIQGAAALRSRSGRPRDSRLSLLKHDITKQGEEITLLFSFNSR